MERIGYNDQCESPATLIWTSLSHGSVTEPLACVHLVSLHTHKCSSEIILT